MFIIPTIITYLKRSRLKRNIWWTLLNNKIMPGSFPGTMNNLITIQKCLWDSLMNCTCWPRMATTAWSSILNTLKYLMRTLPTVTTIIDLRATYILLYYLYETEKLQVMFTSIGMIPTSRRNTINTKLLTYPPTSISIWINTGLFCGHHMINNSRKR